MTHNAEIDTRKNGVALCIVRGCKNRARGVVESPDHDCWYCPEHACPNTLGGGS